MRISDLAGIASLILFSIGPGCVTYQTRAIRYDAYATPEQFKDIDGRKIHFRDVGSGEPIVFIHGYGAGGVTFDPLIKELNRRGYRAILPDLPGFGLSDKYKDDYSFAAYRRILSKLLAELNIESAFWVGHSWGGNIALVFAETRPHMVKKLILINASVYEESLPHFFRMAKVPVVGEASYALFYKERIADRLFMAFYDPDRHVDQKLIDLTVKFSSFAGVTGAAYKVARDTDVRPIVRMLDNVRVPTLVLWGEQDFVVPVTHGIRLARDIPGALLRTFQGCGHLPMLECAPETLTAIVEFLESR